MRATLIASASAATATGAAGQDWHQAVLVGVVTAVVTAVTEVLITWLKLHYAARRARSKEVNR